MATFIEPGRSLVSATGNWMFERFIYELACLLAHIRCSLHCRSVASRRWLWFTSPASTSCRFALIRKCQKRQVRAFPNDCFLRWYLWLTSLLANGKHISRSLLAWNRILMKERWTSSQAYDWKWSRTNSSEFMNTKHTETFVFPVAVTTANVYLDLQMYLLHISFLVPCTWNRVSANLPALYMPGSAAEQESSFSKTVILCKIA